MSTAEHLRRTHKDFADAVELIARHGLSRAAARRLHNSVRSTFRKLVINARWIPLRRVITRLENAYPRLDASRLAVHALEMKLTDLVVLVPCHSLEDFPTHHTGRAAEGLLAAWSAPWHPALLAAALKTPAWHRADDPPAPSAGLMIFVPTVVAAELPDDYQRARGSKCGAG